jgi:hypothetical protein
MFSMLNIIPRFRMRQHDWYVSDIETNWRPPGFPWEDQWIIGDELATLLHAYKVQFISAVFSAVPKGIRTTCSSAPYVQNNPRYLDGTELGPHRRSAVRNRLLRQSWSDSVPKGTTPVQPSSRYLSIPTARKSALRAFGTRSHVGPAAIRCCVPTSGHAP